MHDGLTKFLDCLKPKKPCLLLAHNAQGFDAKHLIEALTSCGQIDEFCQITVGFSDTLPAFREMFPDRKSFSQQALATDLLDATYNAHSALDDVKMLQTLSTSFISDTVLLKHSFTNSWVQRYIVYLSQKSKALRTLQPLICLKKISKSMAEKVSASGLTLEHLQLAYSRGGVDAISNVLIEKFDGRARVTSNKRVIRSICSYFQAD